MSHIKKSKSVNNVNALQRSPSVSSNSDRFYCLILFHLCSICFYFDSLHSALCFRFSQQMTEAKSDNER